MLSVCATAGLGFDQSLQRVSEYWETPIGAEFGRVISEMEMGLSRRDALRNLADRLDITELSSFVAFVLQTEQLGTSIVDTMHSQADQMRVERRYRAQEQAQKIPTKMIIPMVFLIFPALLAIILGPVIPLLYTFLQSLGQ
jgi:tight adherence protein C